MRGDALASSPRGNNVAYLSIVVNLSGPAVAAPGEEESLSAGIKTAAFLPAIQSSGDPNARERYDDVALRMLQLVNEERRNEGCDPVVLNDKLTLAAQRHSQDMAENNFFDHQGSDGSWPHERVLREGYNYGYIGESIAKPIVQTPDAVFSLWMNSPDHRAILLNCLAEDIGVGYVIPYWTAVLAQPR